MVHCTVDGTQSREARFAKRTSVVCTPWLLGAISHLESIMYMVHLVECTIVLYVENNHFDVGSQARLLLSTSAAEM